MEWPSAAVIIAGIVGASASLVAGVLGKRQRDDDDTPPRDVSAVCPAHAGLATDIKWLKGAVSRIETSVQALVNNK